MHIERASAIPKAELLHHLHHQVPQLREKLAEVEASPSIRWPVGHNIQVEATSHTGEVVKVNHKAWLFVNLCTLFCFSQAQSASATAALLQALIAGFSV